jgi:hypothetical protein
MLPNVTMGYMLFSRIRRLPLAAAVAAVRAGLTTLIFWVKPSSEVTRTCFVPLDPALLSQMRASTFMGQRAVAPAKDA